jgi:hypothetical protein
MLWELAPSSNFYNQISFVDCLGAMIRGKRFIMRKRYFALCFAHYRKYAAEYSCVERCFFAVTFPMRSANVQRGSHWKTGKEKENWKGKRKKQI